MFWLAGCLRVCGHASRLSGCMFRPLTWPNEGLRVSAGVWVAAGRCCLCRPAVTSLCRLDVCLRSSCGIQTSGRVWSAWDPPPPLLCGHGQTGLLRNHCDCSWRPATVKGKEERKSSSRTSHCFLYFPWRLLGRKDSVIRTPLFYFH